MQVGMNGGIIVIIAIVLIGILATGLVVYYIRKGRAERDQVDAEASSTDRKSAPVDADE